MKKLICCCAIAALCGCATKSAYIDGAGMYANGKTGIVGIGALDIQAIPDSIESAFVKYAEDTAWLSPSTKTHEVKVILTGTNATEHIEKVVASICDAFKSAPSSTPIVGGANVFDVLKSAQKAVSDAKNADACEGDACNYQPGCSDCTP